ncbi:MAG: aryl-sulfate sulfotransferase [Bacteroidia bacterium]|nr:aryl-sulfate sulfotransferase [Bacteroidia bacterium]
MKQVNIILLIVAIIFVKIASAQTMGVMTHTAGSTDNGYVLFAPNSYTETYLIDKCGRLMHSWHSNYLPGNCVSLLPDGNLLRPGNCQNTVFVAGGRGGVIEKIDWDSNVLWRYFISDSTQCQHHDVYPMPNGNVLAVVWDYKNPVEAIAAGRDTAKIDTAIWSEKIIELQPIGTDSAIIVWEWKLWDHLVQEYNSVLPNYGVVADHPELININFTRPFATKEADWVHMNSVAYNPYLDQIVMSAHNMNEIWIIDHSTTKAEAAGHTGGNSGKGGDLLYRWGNPLVYGHGVVANKKLYGQHSAYWIEPGFPFGGSIMLFNNGANRPTGSFSTVDIITTPVDSNGNYNQTLPYLPTSLAWTYSATVPTSFFSSKVSGAQMLPNGHVMACLGNPGKLFEFDETNATVWKYFVPVGTTGPLTQGTTPIGNSVFRCTFYPDTFSGFNNHIMVSGLPIELNPLTTCELFTNIDGVSNEVEIFITPNPANDFIEVSNKCISELMITTVDGKQIRTVKNNSQISTQNLSNGMYLLKVKDCTGVVSYSKFMVNK